MAFFVFKVCLLILLFDFKRKKGRDHFLANKRQKKTPQKSQADQKNVRKKGKNEKI